MNEIGKLKESLNLKKKVFALIKEGKKEKAKKILEKNKGILSYFIKFKHPKNKVGIEEGKVILLHLGGWMINYNSYYENEILEDINKLEKDIEEKENRLERKRFLKKQQEFIDLQKRDLEENKESRKEVERFTFVLAFGVIATLIFNWFQILLAFQNSKTTHLSFIGGIFIIIFLLMVFFLIFIMKMGKQIKEFVFRREFILTIIVAFLFIGLFVWLLVITPNVPINQETSSHEAVEIQKNQTEILNNILNEQIKINENVDKRLNLLEGY